MPLRILQVVEPGTDGVFRHVEGLCGHLLSAGHQISLAYSSVRGSDRLEELVRRVESQGGQCCDLRTGNSPGWGDFRSLWRLFQIERRAQPMLIHAHSSKAGALTRLLRIAGRPEPVIYTPNAYYGMGRSSGIKTAVFNALESGLGGFGITINVSSDEADWARSVLHLAENRIRVIPNVVDTTHFLPGTSVEQIRFRREMEWPDDAIVLGSVGRLSLQKDPLTLYRAVGEAMAVEPRLRFLHVGRGELATRVEELVRDQGISSRVRRLDYMADTAGFYRVVDGFASTSIYEGLPIAVLEALSAGLPLLLSDVPGNRCFQGLGLSHLSMGPAGKADAWARLIREWVRQQVSKGCRNAGTTNHRSVAENHFSFRAGYGRVLELYGEVVERAAGHFSGGTS